MTTAAGLLLIPVGGTALATGKSGTTKASPSVARAIAADTAGVPAKCLVVKTAKSSKSWAGYGPKTPPPSGCPSLGDFFAVVKKERGTWRLIPIANNVQCEELPGVLRAAGASKAVQRDFLSGFFPC